MTDLPGLICTALDRHPSQDAIQFEGRWFTWGDMRTLARGVNQALDAAGVAPDAPVGFVPRTRPEAIAALLSLLAAGRTIRMVYAFQSAAGIAQSLSRPGLAAHSLAAAVLHAGDHAPEIAEMAATQRMALVLLDGMNPPRVACPADSARPSAPTECHIEILTSGTTGPPKHFPIPYSLIEAHFVSTPLTRAQGDDAAAAPPLLLYFPLGNITGLYSTLPTLLRGQRIALLERFTVAGWRSYVLEHRPAHTGVPPSSVRQILDADIPHEELASIRGLSVGAAPLDPEVQKAFEDRYGIPVLPSYGATEFAGPVAMMTLDLHAQWGEAKRGSVGKALPGVRLRVVDADSGNAMQAGETGLLQVISPRIGPAWIGTSDLAMIDADDFLFLKGRADGAITRGGFKILPETVESALLLHPAIAEAAVTAIPDDRVGQVPAAALCIAPGFATPEIAELESHLRRHLLATHIPTAWRFCAELPRTPSLKVDRGALKLLFLNM